MNRAFGRRALLAWPVIAVVALAPLPASAQAVTPFMNYFQPTPIVCPLSTTAWGVPTVGPRDTCNGIEDATDKTYEYWDGKIMQSSDGKYHIFVSRWAESLGLDNGWQQGVAVHAVSDNVLGPYIDSDVAYTSENGKGANVTGIALLDGTYALLVSASRPADIFTSASLYGPWTYQGPMNIGGDQSTNNTTLMQRPDGDFEATGRDGLLQMSKNGILGPYEAVDTKTTYAQTPSGSVSANIAGSGGNGYNEDPVLWYSGGLYHVVYNYWGIRKAYHLMSPDGITGWKNMGIAYDPTTDFVRYTDGTVNHWYNMERPGVVMGPNGHVTHFTFAVDDVPKAEIVGGSGHGTKVIVVPFDGVSFDTDNGGDGGIMYVVDAGPDASGSESTGDGGVEGGGLADAGNGAAMDANAQTRADSSAVDGGLDGSASVAYDSSTVDSSRSSTSDASLAGADGGPVNDGNSSGCGCRTVAPRDPRSPAGVLALGAFALLGGVRRRRSVSSSSEENNSEPA